MSELTDALSALKSDLMAELKSTIVPMVEAAAEKAVQALASEIPVVGGLVSTVVPVVFDEIDSIVAKTLGNVAPANATAPADTSHVAQLQRVQQHVAALTIATGHATSAAMPNTKTQVVAATTPPKAVQPAQAA